jgi:hypothetical protein
LLPGDLHGGGENVVAGFVHDGQATFYRLGHDLQLLLGHNDIGMNAAAADRMAGR